VFDYIDGDETILEDKRCSGWLKTARLPRSLTTVLAAMDTSGNRSC